jgi:hypothetical protein
MNLPDLFVQHEGQITEDSWPGLASRILKLVFRQPLQTSIGGGF